MPLRPLPVEIHPTPNATVGRAGERPRAVVLHTTAGTWESALDWFGRPESGSAPCTSSASPIVEVP